MRRSDAWRGAAAVLAFLVYQRQKSYVFSADAQQKED